MAATLSLRISVSGSNASTKTMQFEPSTLVFDACKIIRQKIAEAAQGNGESLPLARPNSTTPLWQPP